MLGVNKMNYLGIVRLLLGIVKIDARGYQSVIRELPSGMIVGRDCQNYGIVQFESDSIVEGLSTGFLGFLMVP